MISQMYVDKKVKVDRTYQWQIGRMFNSEIKKLNFKNVGDTVKTINNWVENKTNNHITNLITNDDVVDNNGIFWVNVIYFEAIWYNKFAKPLTKNKPFFLNKKNKISVPTMTLLETKLKYKKIDNLDAHIVELPFKIPGEKDTDEMGVVDTFSDNADFSGIAKDTPLHIGKISQKAFIEVKEDGTVATAATTMQMVLRNNEGPLKLEVNRPFLVLLATKKVVLFTARINDPRLI
ncbi:antichymotrypsin-2-like [Aphidius gifuensis]|uniref:antichymotrypsin-2-like n=1 Tax=Aphidius gifuensis TaxID=684658 RepID=UPI001CDD8B26|nr:antichymotrypsin-2-like [Aphidius gifuensis]